MAVHELEVSVRDTGGVAILDLVGDVDSSAEGVLQGAYEEAAREPRPIALNFSGTGYINSTGIALIVRLLAEARRDGRPVRASGLSQHYQEIFRITRLSDFIALDDVGTTQPQGEGGAR